VILRKGPHHQIAIGGAVHHPIELDRVDGPIGPWLGQAGPRDDADHGTVCSGDGLFTASIPLSVLRGASLADGRLQIDDAPTRCWLVKDVVRIELTQGRVADSLPPEEQAKT